LAEHFEPPPLSQRGGLGKMHRLFGTELPVVPSSLNDAVAA
jgi:hypothetical protein